MVINKFKQPHASVLCGMPVKTGDCVHNLPVMVMMMAVVVIIG